MLDNENRLNDEALDAVSGGADLMPDKEIPQAQPEGELMSYQCLSCNNTFSSAEEKPVCPFCQKETFLIKIVG